MWSIQAQRDSKSSITDSWREFAILFDLTKLHHNTATMTMAWTNVWIKTRSQDALRWPIWKKKTKTWRMNLSWREAQHASRDISDVKCSLKPQWKKVKIVCYCLFICNYIYTICLSAIQAIQKCDVVRYVKSFFTISLNCEETPDKGIRYLMIVHSTKSILLKAKKWSMFH